MRAPIDREIERSAVVLGMLDRCTAPAPGKVGRDDSHPELGESLGEKIEVAAVAREPVHADHRSFGIFGSPCRVAHLREAMRAQGEELPEAGLSGAADCIPQPRHLRQLPRGAERQAHGRSLSQSTMPLPRMPCDLPLTNTPTWPPAKPISL